MSHCYATVTPIFNSVHSICQIQSLVLASTAHQCWCFLHGRYPILGRYHLIPGDYNIIAITQKLFQCMASVDKIEISNQVGELWMLLLIYHSLCTFVITLRWSWGTVDRWQVTTVLHCAAHCPPEKKPPGVQPLQYSTTCKSMIRGKVITESNTSWRDC